MNPEHLKIAKGLRVMSGEDALNWVFEKFPIGQRWPYDPFPILRRVNWEKTDQEKLARHFLSKLNYLDANPYGFFLELMKMKRVLMVIEDNLPKTKRDLSMLRYYLVAALIKSSSKENDRIQAIEFDRRLELLIGAAKY